MSPTIELTHQIAAARVQVWNAWTSPERLADWWWHFVPGTQIICDAQVGGSYRFENSDFGVTGHYLEVERHERLVFTWRWIDNGIEGSETDTVTVTFTDADGDGGGSGGTVISVAHPTDEASFEAYETGWRDTLQHLERGIV